MTNNERIQANNAELREAIELAEKLPDAGSGGTPTPTQEKTVDITENGTVEVIPDDGYALSKVTANVDVPIPDGYIVPSGTKDITSNGTHSVTEFESVDVNVPIPDGYIVPSGEIEITENGTHDVTEYASVSVNVASSGGDLPAGYKRADYIKFTEKQVVDTGIICTQNTKLRVLFTREKSSQHYLYGVASSDNTASVTAYLGGSWRFGNKSSSKNPTTNADMVYSGLVSKSTITITGSASSISGVSNFTTIGSLLLGSCRDGDGDVGSPQFIGKVYSFTMWEGEEQVLKLVPVTDGTVYRFYDLVSETFFDSITDTPLDGGNL